MCLYKAWEDRLMCPQCPQQKGPRPHRTGVIIPSETTNEADATVGRLVISNLSLVIESFYDHHGDEKFKKQQSQHAFGLTTTERDDNNQKPFTIYKHINTFEVRHEAFLAVDSTCPIQAEQFIPVSTILREEQT